MGNRPFQTTGSGVFKLKNPIKVAVIGCRFNTKRFILELHQDNITIDTLITLDPKAAKESYAGYEDISSLSKTINSHLLYTPTYNFDDKLKNKIKKNPPDITFCVGWQRLLPKWFLDINRLGVFGMHGSGYQLPLGRGRSPQVWSILEGFTQYHAHIFKYESDADSGLIFHHECFDITPFDTAASLQIKSQMVFNRTLRNRWNEIENGSLMLSKQDSSIKPTYFPKRTSKDGIINWSNNCSDIANFVRAQTHPYPGAYTHYNGEKINIWSGHMFDTHLNSHLPPGIVLDILPELGVLIQTGDHPFLATSLSLHNLNKGDMLSSL